MYALPLPLLLHVGCSVEAAPGYARLFGWSADHVPDGVTPEMGKRTHDDGTRFVRPPSPNPRFPTHLPPVPSLW